MRKAPSVNFWMFPLWTRVTDFRPLSTAYWRAARMRRLDPVTDTGLIPMPESGRMFQPNSSSQKAMSRATSGVPSCSSMPA